MITQKIKLNLVPGGIMPRIKASQYDAGSRILVFKLYNGAQEFSIPTESTVSIRGTKSDHTGFQYECEYSGSEVTTKITDQMTVSPGEVLAELVITKDEKRIATGNFIFENEEAALKEDVPISHTDIPWIERIDDLVDLVEEDAQRAETAADRAEDALGQIGDSVERSETAASQASTSATNAASSATQASNSAAAASTSESNALASEQAAKVSENNASASATQAATSASNAADSASYSADSAANALASEQAAKTSEDNASASKNAAAQSALDASGSASAASASATQAATSATNAATSEGNAAISAANAAASETNASQSATAAAGSATDASNSASDADTSATNAENSATLARKWAVGDSGSGSNVPSDTNNAYYWAQVAASAASGGLKIEIVPELPTTDIRTDTIYLVPSANPEEKNVKDEYLNTNGTTTGWELIGSTKIDLSGYYTKAQVDAIIQDVKDYADGKLAELKEYAESKLDEDYANVYGAKNLLFNAVSSITHNGVTFVQNSDGSVTANGTSAGQQSNMLMVTQSNHPEIITRLAGKRVILTGGKTLYKRVQFWSTDTGVYQDDTGKGVTFTIPTNIASKNFNIAVCVSVGQTVTNEVFYPMLRLAGIKDDTWVPYTKTNKQLTEDVKRLEAYEFESLEAAQVAVQAGEVPDGAIIYIPGENGDASDTYTKAQIDAMLAEKADSDDTYSKTAVDNMLNNKADGLGYNSNTGKLSLMRGSSELGNVTIKCGWKMPSAIAFNQRVDRNWDGLGALWENATDVTADFDSGILSQKIDANNFDDYDLGMQIVKTINIDGTNYTAHIIFAHANAFYGGYNAYAVVDTLNIGCIVYVESYNSVWNDLNADGGYVSSKLRIAVQKVVNAVKAVIGDSHMVSHQVLLTNAVSGGKSSGWAWVNGSYGEAMSATQVCGTKISGSYFDTGEAYEQLALFSQVRPNLAYGNAHVWVRDVLAASYVALFYGSGGLVDDGVGSSRCVSPFIMIK